MKRVGLIGGMSWESSSLFYTLLNQHTQDRLGGLHSAKVVLGSLDFAEIEELQRSGDWATAGRILADEARRLERADADFLVLCTNTMHKVAHAIEDAVGIPLLHLGDVTGRAVVAAGVETVGLLGTAFTMEQDFYADRIRSHGPKVLVPAAEDRELVHRVIYEELVLGEVRDSSRKEYERIIGTLVARGAQGVILGCTEIELLVDESSTSVPLFPTTLLHVQATLDEMLG